MRLLVFLLLGIGLFGCDGRYKLKNSKPEAVKAFNLKTQNETVINYIPNEIAEIEVDTLIFDKTSIKINSKLNKHDVVIIPTESTPPHTVLAYQNTQTIISIRREDKVLFNKNIEKTLFDNSDSFWKFAVLESVWVNQELSSANDVVIDVIFKNPVLNHEKLCYLKVKDDGSYMVQLI